MAINVLYSTAVRATGGRDGEASTADGSFSVKLSTPKELWGAGGSGTNPEQLFAAGYAACFLNAIKYIAGQQKTPFPAESSITATVGIGPQSDGEGFALTVALAVSLPGLDPANALALTEAAHKVCPYSNAVRNNIDVQLSVV